MSTHGKRDGFILGMIPGCVGGQYEAKDACINLRKLSAWCGATFLECRCTGEMTKKLPCTYRLRSLMSHLFHTGIDVDKRIVFTDHPEHGSVAFDCTIKPKPLCAKVPCLYHSSFFSLFIRADLSIDIGSRSKGVELPGVREFCIPTRPISALSDRIHATIAQLKVTTKCTCFGQPLYVVVFPRHWSNYRKQALEQSCCFVVCHAFIVQELEQKSEMAGEIRLVVVGSGAAGYELACCAQYKFQQVL